jgi:hypothetical protein
MRRYLITLLLQVFIWPLGAADRDFYQTTARDEAALADKLEASEFEEIAALLQIADGATILPPA